METSSHYKMYHSKAEEGTRKPTKIERKRIAAFEKYKITVA